MRSFHRASCGSGLGLVLLCLSACADDGSGAEVGDAAGLLDAALPVAPDAGDDGVGDPSDAGPALDAAAGDGASPPPDDTPPVLLLAIPADGAVDVSVDGVIELSFSEPVRIPTGGIAAVDERTGSSLVLDLTSMAESAQVSLVLRSPVALPAAVLLSLTADITDLAGNAFVPLDIQFALPVWLPLGGALNRDPSTDVTDVRIDVDQAGRPVLLFVEGGDVHAIRIESSGTMYLGNASVNSLPALASLRSEPRITLSIGSDGQPLAAFRESTGLVVRRFDGSNWADVGVDLDPEGGGQYAPALALDPGGAPVVAYDVIGGSSGLRLRRFANDSWQTLESLDIDVRAVRLAGIGGPLALAYHDATAGELSVLRWQDTLSGPIASPAVFAAPAGGLDLAVGSADRLGLTARGRGTATLEAGSFAGLAQDMGFLIGAEASDRSLAYASSGELFAAFSERPPGVAVSRVFVQRLQDGRFQPMGPPLNRDPDANGWAVDVAVGEDSMVAVAWIELSAAGVAELFVSRYNGPPAAAPLARLDRSHDPGCLAELPADGSSLQATGCFSDSPARNPVAGFVPFDVRSPLWSDGAFKRRFVMLPRGETIAYTEPGIWSLPEGSILIKEFSIEARAGDPATLRPVETRFLVVRDSGNWDRYSYEWNQEATQALLREADPVTDIGLFDVVDEGGVATSHRHYYPNRSFCLQCHETPGTVLGLQTLQFNRNLDYGDTVDNQLRAMQASGMFDAAAASALEVVAPHMPNPDDSTYNLESRVRAYLHANCSSCHHPLFGMDLRYEIATLDSGLCTKIEKGNLDNSRIYWRDVLRQQSPGMAGPMPPLGTLVVDPRVEVLLTDWILDPLNVCP